MRNDLTPTCAYTGDVMPLRVWRQIVFRGYGALIEATWRHRGVAPGDDFDDWTATGDVAKRVLAERGIPSAAISFPVAVDPWTTP